ncbi:MAG: aldehyde ferredoxin oxidoreductase C-terminal domain-containing protein, partial [Clostridiales bacterium]|nr:aldehyde ferredoxin oxidoreductase C-terminal domain-containing protein [Clostridiales bacterium]
DHFAMHIKGLELTGYDIRGLKTAALGYAVSRRGGDHQRHGSYSWDLSGKVDRYSVDAGRGALVKGDEDFYAVIDSMIICKFTRTIWKDGYEEIAKVYSLVTGIPMTGEELRRAGERMSNLARVLNIREGLTRADDTIPPRISEDPIPEGVGKGASLSLAELDILLDGYYDARGWTEQGVPKPDKLAELNLENYAHIVAEQ